MSRAPQLTVLLGLFGTGDSDLSTIASYLDTDADARSIERELDRLNDAISTIASQADLEQQVADPLASEASPVETAAALERAIDQGSLSIEAGDGHAPNDGRLRSAAVSTRSNLDIESQTATVLMENLVGERRDAPAQLANTLADSLQAIDRHEDFQRAITQQPIDVDPETPADLVEAFTEERQRANQLSSEHDQLSEAVTDLLRTLDIEPESDNLTESVRTATREIDVGGEATDRTEIVWGAQIHTNPRSSAATDLFEGLMADDDETAVQALATAAEQLNRDATNRSIVQNTDREEVLSLADDLAAQFPEHGGTITNRLAERVDQLITTIARADESNDVIVYAAQQELQFYDRHLADVLNADVEGAGAETQPAASERVTSRLDAITEQHNRIEREYIEKRSDHNHSIPLYFLSLADTYRDEAAATIDSGRITEAQAMLSVVEDILDHVEGLYEKNEYSVMLRSLRG